MCLFRRSRFPLHLLLPALLLAAAGPSYADEIRIAVASNFIEAIRHIAERFEASSSHRVTLIPGSTGKHYAQIKHGAPFDLFFAADTRRPRLLEAEGDAVAGSRFTYALGKLVLWSPAPGYVDEAGKVLQRGDFRHLALANPKLAPYGMAAQQVLQAQGVWASLQGRMVRGENIGQAFQFVRAGNAELGFVAYSQLKRPGQAVSGSVWDIPAALYTPIEQQAVLLRGSPEARAFLAFVQGSEARSIILGFGYGAP